MQQVTSKLFVCLAAVVLMWATALPAWADDLDQPCWRSGPGSTFQHWTFDSNSNPAGPEQSANPYGAAEAGITVLFPSQGWIFQALGYDTNRGYWDLGWNGLVTLYVPNDPAGPVGAYKYVKIQVVDFESDFHRIDGISITAPPGAVRVSSATQIVNAQPALGDWVWRQEVWRLETCPTGEFISIQGGSQGCIIDQIVVDTLCVNPQALCQATNVVLPADAGQCSKTNVTYPLPTADGCIIMSASCTPTSGSTFPVGSTVVTCSLTDFQGQVNSCTFTVTIQDTTAPVLTCPTASILANTDPGQCTATVDYTVTATDNCTSNLTVVCVPSSKVFPLGTNVVVCSVNDGQNTSRCEFNVVVSDNQAPVFANCVNLQVNAPTNECAATVQYGVSASDNCDSNVVVVCTPPSGSLFDVGDSNVVCTATDSSGNSSTCAFTVTVKDTTPPVVTLNGSSPMTVECHGSFTDPGATALDACAGILPVTVSGTVDANVVGSYTLTYSATDPDGNTGTATRTVNVLDTIPPVISGCPTNVTVGTDAACTASFAYAPTALDACNGPVAVVCVPPSPGPFALGTTDVFCTAVDASTNMSRCNFQVTVVDDDPPVAVCSTNIFLPAPGVVDYVVSVTDNCPGATISCTPTNGSFFPEGVHDVNCTATDAAGLTGTCTFTVTVRDTEPPVAICSSNLVQNTDLGLCSAVVTYVVSVTDNAPNPTIDCLPASGTAFDKGVTTVVCTATDSSGNTNICTFTVTVNDAEAPVAVCPANLVVSTDAGKCEAVVTFSALARDNCPGATIACVPASGSVFALGTTTVNCTATDASGHTGTCSFTVTVEDKVAPVVTCPSDITKSTEPGLCTAVVTYSATALDDCDGPVAVTCQPPSGTVLGVGGPYPVVCTAVDRGGNTGSCTFTVTINDLEPPTMNCPISVVANAEPGTCFSRVDCCPKFSDNCPGATVACIPPRGDPIPVGTTVVVCTAMDASGNTAVCSFSVTILDPEPPSITCPADIVTNTDAGLCTAVVQFSPVARDNCPNPQIVCMPASGSAFPKGATTVWCTVTDASGNTNICNFKVTVNDAEAPVPGCPANIVQSTDAGKCDAVVTFAATVSDNCPGASVACVPASGSTFPKGVSTVECTATDASGNMNRCTFTVTIHDTELPTITCPANLVMAADPGHCDAVVTYSLATAADNCPGVQVACEPPSGSAFPAGVNNVTCTATDASGNTKTCAFTITVTEKEKPIITCAPDIAVACDSSLDPSNTGMPTAWDRCDTNLTFTYVDGAPVLVTSGDLDGWNLLVGGTPLTAVAEFIEGPATPPLPKGSLRLAIGNNGDGIAEGRNFNYSGILLSDLTELSYVSYRTTDGSGVDQSIYLALNIDTDNDNRADDVLVFEPVWQNGSNPLLPVQGPLVTGAWQKWNVLIGGWWSMNNPWVASPGAGVESLAVYLASYPNARILNEGNNGGIRLVAGDIGAWVGFDGAVDCVSIGVRGVSKTYNFEKTASANVCPQVVIRTWTATDDSGNMMSCSQKISLIDEKAPTITCPSPITQGTDAGKCSAVVTFAPTATDTCDQTPSVACLPASGSAFAKGATMVTCWAWDDCGNSNSCTFTVTINDTEAPAITCPTNLVVGTAPGLCSAVVTYAANATDNCPGVGVACVPDSGSVFQKGVSSVTCTATDAVGLTKDCTFTVTVRDVEAPVIVSCAASQEITVGANCRAPLPDLTGGVVARDNCDTTLIVTQSPAAGTQVGLGVTTVTLTVRDAAGNSTTCQTTVTAKDVTPPVVTCKPAILYLTGASVTVRPGDVYSSGSDNCGTVNLVSVTPDTFTCAGTNSVVLVVNDGHGNTASCTATVIVYDLRAGLAGSETITKPVGSVIPDNDPAGLSSTINVTTPIAWVTNVQVSLTVTGSYNGDIYAYLAHGSSKSVLLNRVGRRAADPLGYGDAGFNVTFSDSAANGDVHVYRLKLFGNHTTPLSGALSGVWAPDARATDPSAVLDTDPRTSFLNAFNGMNPNGQWVLFLADNENGDVHGLASWTLKIDGWVVDGAVAIVQQPASQTVECGKGVATFTVVTSGITPTSYQWRKNGVPIPGANGPSYSITNPVLGDAGGYDVVITHACGSLTSAVAVLTVVDTTPPVVTCPADIVVPNAPGLCNAVVTYPAASATDLCDSAPRVVCTPASGSTFPVGTNVVTCTATDASGNVGRCQFKVVVVDVELPVLVKPTVCCFKVNNDPGQCGARVQYAVPDVTDNCPGATVTCTPPSGSFLPIGSNNVVCVGRDAWGNRAECSFIISVLDVELPVVHCPAPITVNNEPGQCTAMVKFPAPLATDNCPGVSVACFPPSGTLFPVGANLVTCVAWDASQNVGDCTFSVTVRDTEAPKLECSRNLTVDNDAGSCGAVVNYQRALAVDNCDSVTATCTPAPGSFFNVGTTTVTCRAPDAHGNVGTCTFTITVRDTEKPVISACPTNRTVYIGASCTVVVPNVTGGVIASDNCGNVTVTQSPAAGTPMGLGPIPVVLTVRDAAGNTATCSMTLTVADPNPPKLSISLLCTNYAGLCTNKTSYCTNIVVPCIRKDCTNLVISWPTTSPCKYVLEDSAYIYSLIVWNAVTNPVVISGGKYTVTVPVEDRVTRFYRLRYQP